MNTSAFRSSLAGLALFGILTTSLAAPALADGAASTRNIIGAAAAIIGIATAVNVSNKNRVANTVEGYLPDGSVVFEDGHVVDRNGNSWYPGNQGEQIACNGQSCIITSNDAGYYNNGYYNNQGNGSQYNAGYAIPYNNPQYNVQFYGNSRNLRYDGNVRNGRNDAYRGDRNNQNSSDTRRPPA
jgi:hypothetical protein